MVKVGREGGVCMKVNRIRHSRLFHSFEERRRETGSEIGTSTWQLRLGKKIEKCVVLSEARALRDCFVKLKQTQSLH